MMFSPFLVFVLFFSNYLTDEDIIIPLYLTMAI